tara:strand:+ start:152 stop:421 length:270 start_codon:yes stop_codon:yes gene_type:complete
MNIERITKAKHAIANYISQIDAMRRAHTEIEVAISHFNAVHEPIPAYTPAAFNNRRALRDMADGLEMQIRVANVRINNLKRVIDEEVNA